MLHGAQAQMLPQLGNSHDCLRHVKATLLAIYGPMDEEGTNHIEGGGSSGTSRGSFLMAATSSGDITKEAPLAAGRT